METGGNAADREEQKESIPQSELSDFDTARKRFSAQIRPETSPQELQPDAYANEEKRKFKDHSLDDADDNYAIRKAVKEQFIAHARCMFRIVLGFTCVLVCGLLLLIIDYIWCIWDKFEKVESLLSHMFTHSLALIAGLLLKAVFGGTKHSD